MPYSPTSFTDTSFVLIKAQEPIAITSSHFAVDLPHKS